VRADAPIFASSQIVEEGGIEFEHDDAEGSEAMVEKFRSFLDDVTPDDFMQHG
jgi:bifunctional DNase/RNase